AAANERGPADARPVRFRSWPRDYLTALWRNTERARTLMISTASGMSREPAHASSCHSVHGQRANWKLTTGRFAIGAFMLVAQNWLLSAVNSSGAVSPEMRATASSTPVMTPP